MSEFDFVIVGSGINSLVCAAMLALDDLRVCVVERNDRLGGCIRTDEVTLPGFQHEVMASFYPLFVSSPAFKALEAELEAEGVRFRPSARPTAVAMPDGRAFVMSSKLESVIADLDTLAPGDGQRYARALSEASAMHGVLGNVLDNEPRGLQALFAAWNGIRHMGINGLVEHAGRLSESARDWLETTFESDVARALFAPWVLHMGLDPDASGSGGMLRLQASLMQNTGLPCVEGGGIRLIEAFVRIVARRGGIFMKNAEVERVGIEHGAARGVTLTDGTVLRAKRAVVCNVTPTQLYDRLLPAGQIPERVKSDAKRFRYGLSDMQIHLALRAPVDWVDPALNDVAMVHVTAGIDAIARASNEARRRLLPAEPTIVVAQHAALDPSRVPVGHSLLWIQLQELPARPSGDAAGEIETSPDSQWTPAIREAYADRVINRLATLMPELKQHILMRTVFSPRDLEAINVNLVGGDPYSGACSIAQSLAWRPFPSSRGHATPFKRLYHIGASTHPGPGVGGMSGFMVARHLLGRRH
ncbi:phytoene desaturase family protein [Pararobbsia silviterrae]|uniref:NAD(P)/FAD-dependent oxidoreductase n=1 Tax=Pararobbsia silviterrae TaxID=1792498 RepID=A0A494X2S4_9BURK|nr:NAD(P)/FAD-dependent oxidoreductase [Pararobbsia silviterrae]RKP43921.1 NAD(P)/FAD-dependent oxidoreductase [Pararobbsia silviterrae]